MKAIATLSLIVVAYLLIPTTLSAKGNSATLSIKGVMILASNDSTETDPSLRAYEKNLRRLFRFKSYKRYGSGNTRLNLPGKSTMSMGRGHQVEVDAKPINQQKSRISIRWLRDGRSQINTTLVMTRGKPAVLGGPSVKGGNLILIITAH